MRLDLTDYERRQTRKALAVIPRKPLGRALRSCIRLSDVRIGRERERQLIAEAERIARRGF